MAQPRFVPLRIVLLWLLIGLPSLVIMGAFAVNLLQPQPETGARAFAMFPLAAAVFGFGYTVARTVYTLRTQRSE